MPSAPPAVSGGPGGPPPADTPMPVASRLRPPGWRDRRLVVGVVLVLASVAFGASVIARADNTQPVYAAGHPLLPGQRLTTDDLQVVHVRLGGQRGRYLGPAALPADGAVVIRSVQDGELVPASAVGTRDAVTSRPVAVPVPAAAAQGLRPGSLVDVWIATKGDTPQTYDEPKAVVRGAEVVTVSAGSGVLSSSSDASVRLLLDGDLVPQVLSAVDNGARVDVVPVPGSLSRSGS
jgi:hypothetical protein